MRWLQVGPSWLLWVAFAGAGACSGDSFEAAPSGGGGSGGASGKSGAPGSGGTAGNTTAGASGTEAGGAGSPTAGTGGNGLQAGAAGATNGGSAGATNGGSAGATVGGSGGVAGGGSGGAAAISCSSSAACPADNYCRLDEKVCAPCTDLSRVVLGPAVEVLTPAPGPMFYPRVARGEAGSFLLSYRKDDKPGELVVLRSTSESWTPDDDAVVAPPISEVASHESGLFILPSGIAGSDFGATTSALSDKAFRFALFDSDRSGGDGGNDRSIYVARLPVLGAKPGLVEKLSKDINGDDGKMGDDFSPAYAEGTKRIYWVRRRTQPLESFVLLSKKANSGESPLPLAIPTTTCPAGSVFTPFNYAPWVTPDGRHIFYQQACNGTVSGGALKVLIVHGALDATGTLISDVEVVDTTGDVASSGQTLDRSPALSPNQCRLYWERDEKLVSAPRQ